MAQKKHGDTRHEGSLEKKWRSYTGTGVTASKGRNSLALREGIGGDEFAIVKLYGGCWATSPIEVIEEIRTPDRNEAEERFHSLAKKLGFEADRG